MRWADASRALLLIVAIVAALVGITARAATGEEAASSRRHANSRRTAAQVHVAAATGTAVAQSQQVETFVLRKVTMESHGAEGAETKSTYPAAKRFVANSNNQPMQPTVAAPTGGLQWRSRTPQHFRAIGTQPSPVQPAAHFEPATTQNAPSRVEPVQASRLAQPETEDVLPGDDPPALDVPPLTVPPATDLPPLDLPDVTDPPINIDDLLPPITPEPGRLPEPDDGLGIPRIDPGAGAGVDAKRPRCAENYRDIDCCEQGRLCEQRWKKLESKRLAGFTMDLLDITPLYHPDWREELPEPGEGRVDEETARRRGLALNTSRMWKNVDGAVVFTGMLVGQPVDRKIKLRSATGEEAEFELSGLSLDDNYWVSGRPWRNRDGEQIARGRLVDYRWGRVVVADAGGRVSELPIHELGNDEFCYVGAYWGQGVGLPDECRIHGEYELRNFTLTSFHWTASALCHKPLYFEEVQLERYGHSHGPLAQPVVSTAHFFVNIAILPYKMGINPPHECMYALGYYRPGSCAPYMIPPVPYSIRGGLYEAGAWVGGVAIFP